MTTKKKVTKKKIIKKDEKAKGPGGAPTLYDPKYCDMLIEHMSQGLSYETFAAVTNVCVATIYNWEVHPEFLEAKRRAFAQSQLFWEKAGNAGMYQGKNFVSNVWIFNMKNRFNWKDKKEVEHGTEKDAVFKFAFDLAEKPKE